MGTAPAPAPDPQGVNIVFKKSDDENSLTVKPGKFHIYTDPAKGPVQVEWNCASPGLSIDFYGPNGSPFPESHYPTANGGYLSSPATRYGDFKYRVTIGENVLDPDGQVDP
jgi:hypothetical protein